MGEDTQTALTYNYLVLDTIQKMRDAQAEGNRDKYFVYFDYAMGFAIHHLDLDTRRKVEDSRKTLKTELKRIKEQVDLNDQTRKLMILELKESFANAHRYYVMLVLSKIGVVKVSEEGVIDFNDFDIDELAKVVRSDRGLNSAMDSNVKKVAPNVQ